LIYILNCSIEVLRRHLVVVRLVRGSRGHTSHPRIRHTHTFNQIQHEDIITAAVGSRCARVCIVWMVYVCREGNGPVESSYPLTLPSPLLPPVQTMTYSSQYQLQQPDRRLPQQDGSLRLSFEQDFFSGCPSYQQPSQGLTEDDGQVLLALSRARTAASVEVRLGRARARCVLCVPPLL